MSPEALAALHAACFTLPRPWSAAEFAGLMTAPGTFLCPAPGGFALGRAIGGEAELLTLAVAPEARRQGLGRRLLAAFERDAMARDADTAFLEVAADNLPARALYVRAGYHEAGRRPAYYTAPGGERVDALVLRKALSR